MPAFFYVVYPADEPTDSGMRSNYCCKRHKQDINQQNNRQVFRSAWVGLQPDSGPRLSG